MPVISCRLWHASCKLEKNKSKKKKKIMREVVGKNLKLYCTTLCQRSNGLTSQLLANGTMGEQRREKDRTMASETTHNTKGLPWLGSSQKYSLCYCCFSRHYLLFYVIYLDLMKTFLKVIYTFLLKWFACQYKYSHP